MAMEARVRRPTRPPLPSFLRWGIKMYADHQTRFILAQDFNSYSKLQNG